MTDLTAVLVAFFTATVPSIITLITSKRASQQSDLHSAKQSILQMILEDRMRVDVYHHLPENYQSIMKEFDVYTKNGGNSYVHDKVLQYEEWYRKLADTMATESKTE